MKSAVATFLDISSFDNEIVFKVARVMVFAKL